MLCQKDDIGGPTKTPRTERENSRWVYLPDINKGYFHGRTLSRSTRSDRSRGAQRDLLMSDYGTRRRGWRGYRAGRVTDPLFDLRLAFNGGFRALARSAAQMPVRRVHVASVDVPARRHDLEAVLRSPSLPDR